MTREWCWPTKRGISVLPNALAAEVNAGWARKGDFVKQTTTLVPHYRLGRAFVLLMLVLIFPGFPSAQELPIDLGDPTLNNDWTEARNVFHQT